MDGGRSLSFDLDVARNGDEGCAYILDGGGRCRAAQQAGSPYCPHHHALCHIPEGSLRERRRLRETEALASAVGGRRGRAARRPPDPLLRKLENIARGFARPKRSRIVREGQE